ncbi:conserved Plasmodium protein, unknown function [Plasmodium ovale]|uniref:WIBG Mago-binding domain-containing protein n=2 Tax=Plasmodium ovale TaxID=36330 RepID=A0A1A8W5W2_PLAOA|nr:conserved Plasmodium protein, unknown function [Plasmodium ovale curtisi]SBS97362.1 conserved Plasmodium protein, unknown function [Plasmodium ovale curtisi]SCP06017.1 conserved Plasmodium protein, unknown function [Plasmodium ovale]
MKRGKLTESKLANGSFNSLENSDNTENYLKEVVTPLGDVYILNEKTNEKFIKGTQRSDGTFRKSIRVRTDYMPQEENSVYQVKGKILEEKNKNRHIYASVNVSSNIISNNSVNNNVNKTGERKVPGWNPVDANANEDDVASKKKKKKKKKKNIEIKES